MTTSMFFFLPDCLHANTQAEDLRYIKRKFDKFFSLFLDNYDWLSMCESELVAVSALEQ